MTIRLEHGSFSMKKYWTIRDYKLFQRNNDRQSYSRGAKREILK